jgi:hypothetical protein
MIPSDDLVTLLSGLGNALVTISNIDAIVATLISYITIMNIQFYVVHTKERTNFMWGHTKERTTYNPRILRRTSLFTLYL